MKSDKLGVSRQIAKDARQSPPTFYVTLGGERDTGRAGRAAERASELEPADPRSSNVTGSQLKPEPGADRIHRSDCKD